jgi:hypothetical protein
LPGESSFWQRYILVLSGTSHIVFLVWLYTTKHRYFKTCCICVPYFSDTPILHRYSDTRIAGVSHFPTLKRKEKNADTPTILQRDSNDTWNLRSTDTSKPLLAFSFLVCYFSDGEEALQAASLLLVKKHWSVFSNMIVFMF